MGTVFHPCCLLERTIAFLYKDVAQCAPPLTKPFFEGFVKRLHIAVSSLPAA